jgi:hypothetical protein
VSKKGGPKNVPDGAMVSGADLSQEAHSYIPIEWWTMENTKSFGHLATVAVFPHVATQLNLQEHKVSKETLAICYKMLESGEISAEYKDRSGGRGDEYKTTFSDDVNMEEGAAADDEADRQAITELLGMIKELDLARERTKAKAAEGGEPSAKAGDGDDDEPGKKAGGADDGDEAADRLREKIAVLERAIAERAAQRSRGGGYHPGPGGFTFGGGDRTPSAGFSTTLPPTFTAPRRDKKAPEVTKTTPRSVNDRTKLLQLQSDIEGITFTQETDLVQTSAFISSAGRADISDLPTGALIDVFRRLEADAAVVDIVVKSFRDTDGAAGAGLQEKVRDATCLTILKNETVAKNISPFDRLFNLVPVASMIMVTVKQGFVAPTVTQRARKFQETCENLSFIGPDGALNAAAAHTLLQRGLAETGSGPADNDWNHLVKEVLGAMGHGIDLSFVGVDTDGSTLDWATTAQQEIDKHGMREGKPYDQGGFQRLIDIIVRFGRAQTRRAQTKGGLMEARAKHNADQVLMLGPGWTGGSADGGWAPEERGGGGDGWGAMPSYLTAGEEAHVRYVKVACINTACGSALDTQYATCLVCGSFQDKVWKCNTCGLYSRGDGARCRYGYTSGCPGTRAEGRVPTKSELAAATEVMQQAKAENKGTGGFGKGASAPGKGSGGKGSGGKGGGGRGGGGGATRVAVMEAVERGMASGDTDRLVQEVRRAHLGI